MRFRSELLTVSERTVPRACWKYSCDSIESQDPRCGSSDELPLSTWITRKINNVQVI